MQTITEIHIKAVLENEFRRFCLNPPTFDNLQSTLRRLFNIENNFSVKFQDDEKDWVLISSDSELLYAVELAGTPLRVQINAVINTPKVPDVADTQEVPSRGKCRWGRGRGGCHQGRFGGDPQLSKEERLAKKTSRLTERISELETKLNSGQVPTEREQVLRWRLLQLQNKLSFVSAMKDSLKDMPSPTDEATEIAYSEEKYGRCGRRGRNCQREKFGCRARLPPEVMAHFHQCRFDLQAARASGNPEQIQAAQAAFLAAKQRKFEAREQWRAAKKGEDGAEATPSATTL